MDLISISSSSSKSMLTDLDLLLWKSFSDTFGLNCYIGKQTALTQLQWSLCLNLLNYILCSMSPWEIVQVHQ